MHETFRCLVRNRLESPSGRAIPIRWRECVGYHSCKLKRQFSSACTLSRRVRRTFHMKHTSFLVSGTLKGWTGEQSIPNNYHRTYDEKQDIRFCVSPHTHLISARLKLLYREFFQEIYQALRHVTLFPRRRHAPTALVHFGFGSQNNRKIESHR